MAAVILALPAADPARAQATLPDGFSDQLVVGGMSLPTGIAFVPDAGANAGRRLFVVEQDSSKVRLVVDGALAAIDPSGIIANTSNLGGERGLLGIAVDPRWPVKPYVYVHHSSGGTIRIARYTCTGDVAFTGNGALALDDASRYELINDAPDANYNHSGGTLRFAADSTLYVSLGDDGNACAAQDTTSLRGVILRLEVRNLPDGPGGPPAKSLLVPAGNPFPAHPSSNARLVWATGLRNPFRFHIDPAGGQLFVADVGEASREEVDILARGANAGWPMFEGDLPYITCNQAVLNGFTSPVYTYDHSQGYSIIGLGVYRRAGLGASRFPADYEGDYFFADYYTGWIRRISGSGAQWSLAAAPGQPDGTNWGVGAKQVSDALIAPDGALWYVKQGVNYAPYSGEVRAIRYTGTVGVTPASGAGLTLSPAWPNPARGFARLDFSLASAAPTELVVLDLAGRRVRTLVSGTLEAGPHQATWDGLDEAGARLPAGLYFARLLAAGQQRQCRIALTR